MCLMSDFAPDRLQWGRRGGGGCGGGGGVGVLHCSWSEAKTKSAILWWFCLSSVVFTQWLSTFLGVMEYLITPLKAFCPSTCSKICTHALQTVETQSCVLANTLVFSHFSPKLYTHIWCSWRMGSSLLTVWRPHDFIFGAVRGGPHYVSARLNGLFVLAWLWRSSAWGCVSPTVPLRPKGEREKDGGAGR